ncbi:MAG: hypothetical protein HDR88_16760 [Bacteroides sp.]|nr:hypothetical protein [Bacteroides sp.]
MKTLLTYILLAILIVSCHQSKPIDEMFRWPTSGVTEADSLLALFEWSQVNQPSEKIISAITEQFCSISHTYPNNQLIQFRTEYLKAHQLIQKHKDEASTIIEGAMRNFDSILSPYDWHKMKTLKIEVTDRPDLCYTMAMDNLAFFHNANVPAEEGRALIVAGNVMSHLLDTVRAVAFYNEAAKINSQLNLKIPTLMTWNNIATISPHHKRDSILSSLLNLPTIDTLPTVKVLLLHNHFIDTDSVALLEEAIGICINEHIHSNNLPLLLTLQGNWYAFYGQYEKGIEILHEAIKLNSKHYPINARIMFLSYDFLANAYHASDQKDSCIIALDNARIWRDIYEKERNYSGIYAIDTQARINMTEQYNKIKRQRIIDYWLISSLIASVGVGLIIYRIKRKNTIAQYEKMLTEEKLKRHMQSIQAQAGIMEEGNQLISELYLQVTNLKNNNKISGECADNLLRVLRLHKSTEENRQSFLKIKQELDTQFITRLKKDFPSLAESQLRLASLIVVGADSRQIANILNIIPSSVHKNRYRLRARLGLKTEDSLEEFLRRYNI